MVAAKELQAVEPRDFMLDPLVKTSLAEDIDNWALGIKSDETVLAAAAKELKGVKPREFTLDPSLKKSFEDQMIRKGKQFSSRKRDSGSLSSENSHSGSSPCLKVTSLERTVSFWEARLLACAPSLIAYSRPMHGTGQIEGTLNKAVDEARKAVQSFVAASNLIGELVLDDGKLFRVLEIVSQRVGGTRNRVAYYYDDDDFPDGGAPGSLEECHWSSLKEVTPSTIPRNCLLTQFPLRCGLGACGILGKRSLQISSKTVTSSTAIFQTIETFRSFPRAQ